MNNKIEIKYGTGDNVFYMSKGGSIRSSLIMEADVKLTPKNPLNPQPGEDRISVNYRLQDSTAILRAESTLFTSPEELTQSLIKNAQPQAKKETELPADKTEVKK